MTKRPILATKFYPRFPALSNIITKHWRLMKSHDQHLTNVFKEPPLVAFKKQKNLKDLLIRAKVPGPIKERSERKLKGMFKCYQLKCTSCKGGTNHKNQQNNNMATQQKIHMQHIQRCISTRMQKRNMPEEIYWTNCSAIEVPTCRSLWLCCQ